VSYLVNIDGDLFIAEADIEIPTVKCGECGANKPGPETGARVVLRSLQGTEKNQFGRGMIPFCDVKGRVRERIEGDILRQYHKGR
jgi:hypothetical protein